MFSPIVLYMALLPLVPNAAPMTMFTKLFIDTGGFVALADRNDMQHDHAVEFYRALSRNIQRITSLPVISESYAWILYHLGGQQAKQWLRYVEEAETQGLLSVVYPDRGLGKKASQIIYRFEDHLALFFGL